MSESLRPDYVFAIALAGVAVLILSAILWALWMPYGPYGPYYGMMGYVGPYYGMMGYGMMGYYGPYYGATGIAPFYGLSLLMATFVVVALALGAAGVLLIARGGMKNVRTGSIMLIIASVIAFPTVFGLVAGSVLMFTAGLMGLLWSPGTGAQ